jgi:hypothetical protein
MNTSNQIKKEIIDAATVTLPDIAFYQIRQRPDAYGFEKIKI